MSSPLLLSPEQMASAIPAMMDLAQAHFTSQCLYTVLKLGVPNVVGDGQLSVAEIAKALPGTPHQEALLRCMRTLAVAGVFEESAGPSGEFVFALTPMGALLQMGVPQPSMACGVHHFMEKSTSSAWGLLPDYVAGKLEALPFDCANGSPLFDYFREHPESGGPYQEFMDSLSSGELPAVIQEVDWASFAGKTVVDVGGGSGFVMGVVADQFEEVQCISFDLPDIIEANGSPPGGVTFASGDAFDAKSIPKGDVIFMKHFLHNWDDNDAARILKSCSEALPASGVVVVAEAVLPAPGEATAANKQQFYFDALKMLSGGKERTKQQWEALASAAGFGVDRVVDTTSPMCHIITLSKR